MTRLLQQERVRVAALQAQQESLLQQLLPPQVGTCMHGKGARKVHAH